MAKRERGKKNTAKRRGAGVNPGYLAVALVVGVGIGIGVGWLMKPAPLKPELAAAPKPKAHKPVIVFESKTEAPSPAVKAAPAAPASLPPPPPTAAEPPVEQAALVAPPKAISGTPPWLKHAVAAPAVNGRPMIAVVIDDMGVDRARSEKISALPGPLTTAWLTYAGDLSSQTATARRRGHELLVHVPMEPQGADYDPGPSTDVLRVSLAPDEIRRRLAHDLSRFEGFVGINNHMGSRFTADPAGMQVVLDELHRRGLMFLDSVTSEQSVGAKLAQRMGVPSAARHVFLDNENEVDHVRGQLARLEQVARRTGYAVAIGHPRDATIEALASWLPSLQAKGLVLVPLTAVVKRAGTAGG